MGQSTERASQATVDATVINSELVDENLLRRLLVRAGRTLASPALEALELLLDPLSLELEPLLLPRRAFFFLCFFLSLSFFLSLL